MWSSLIPTWDHIKRIPRHSSSSLDSVPFTSTPTAEYFLSKALAQISLARSIKANIKFFSVWRQYSIWRPREVAANLTLPPSFLTASLLFLCIVKLSWFALSFSSSIRRFSVRMRAISKLEQFDSTVSCQLSSSCKLKTSSNRSSENCSKRCSNDNYMKSEKPTV